MAWHGSCGLLAVATGTGGWAGYYQLASTGCTYMVLCTCAAWLDAWLGRLSGRIRVKELVASMHAHPGDDIRAEQRPCALYKIFAHYVF